MMPFTMTSASQFFPEPPFSLSSTEWVDDYNALFIAGDSRTQGDPDILKFCGAGAINVIDRDSYAVLMRIALLSSLNAADTTSTLGFRCARPLEGQP